MLNKNVGYIIKGIFILLCMFGIIFIVYFMVHKGTANQTGFFDLKIPYKSKSYAPSTGNYYLKGFKAGYRAVFHGITVERFSNDIKSQLTHKVNKNILIACIVDGEWTNAELEQRKAFAEGSNDGQERARSIINKALNEHYGNSNIIAEYAKARENIIKGIGNE